MLADCFGPQTCHVITGLPWYFMTAIVVVWAAAASGVAILAVRRIQRRRARRRAKWSPLGVEVEIWDDRQDVEPT